MDLAEIGLRIKKCRRDRHITQEKFAEMIDVSPHYIYEIERGSKAMSLYTLNNIVTYLKVSSDYILYGNENPEKANIPKDPLSLVIEKLPPQKKKSLAEIISVLLPYIK